MFTEGERQFQTVFLASFPTKIKDKPNPFSPKPLSPLENTPIFLVGVLVFTTGLFGSQLFQEGLKLRLQSLTYCPGHFMFTVWTIFRDLIKQ